MVSLLFLIVAVPAASYYFVHTANPVRVFSQGTAWQKVAVIGCCTFAFFSGHYLLVMWFQHRTARRTDPRVRSVLGAVMMTVVLLVLGYLFTGFLNPWESFPRAQGGYFVVLVVTAIVAAMSLLQVIYWFHVIAKVQRKTGQSWRDVDCRFCHKPACEVAPKSGPPLRCPHCGEWVHTLHWLAAGGNPVSRCPECPSAPPTSDLTDLLKQLGKRD
jgi:hypothetical protein